MFIALVAILLVVVATVTTVVTLIRDGYGPLPDRMSTSHLEAPSAARQLVEAQRR